MILFTFGMCINVCSLQLTDFPDHFTLNFFVLENVEKGPICTIELDDNKIQQFTDAIERSYWFELFIGMNLHLIGHCFLILYAISHF